MTTNVLWISRHNILHNQEQILKNKEESAKIIQIDKTISDYSEVFEVLELYNPQYVVANFPKWIWLAILNNLKYRRIIWLRCKMKLVHRTYKGCYEPCELFKPESDDIISTGSKRFGVEYPGRYCEDLHFRFYGYERITLHKTVFGDQILAIDWK